MRSHWYRPESENYLTLDVLRVVSAAAVVVYHYGSFASWPEALLGIRAGLPKLQMAVDLFFVISGIMMADLYGGNLQNRSQYFDFLRRRLARLAPLHYATLGVIALGLAWRALHRHSAFNLSDLLINIGFLQAFGLTDHLTFNQPSWSISAEIAMYAALPLLLWLSRKRLASIALVVGLLISAMLLDFRGIKSWLYLTYDFGVVRAIPSFLIGLVLAQSPWLIKIPKPKLLLGLAMALMFALCTVSVPNAGLLATLYVIAALALAVDRQAKTDHLLLAIAPAARLTYSIYMLHHIVASLLITHLAIDGLGLTGSSLNNAIVLTALVALPAAAAASLVLLETPARKWLSGRATRQPSSPDFPPVSVG